MSRSLHHIRLIMTWPLGRNILENSRSFGNYLCDPVSVTGCQTMIPWCGRERGGGVAFRLFFAGDSTKPRRLLFWFCSSPHQGGRPTGDWVSAAPDLLTVPGQASRYVVSLNAGLVVCIWNLVSDILRNTRRLLHRLYLWGSVAPRKFIFLWSSCNLCCFFFYESDISFVWICSASLCSKKGCYVRESCLCCRSDAWIVCTFVCKQLVGMNLLPV
jgi:hypothetical protein